MPRKIETHVNPNVTPLPPPGPMRPRSPTLRQLIAAEAPVYAKNIRRPASVIQIDYKDGFGNTSGAPLLLPVTDVPIPIAGSALMDGDQIPYESLKTSSNFAKAITKGAIRLYWPDEAEPLLTPDAIEDIREAFLYAQNPNQEGYFPDRETDDVMVEEDAQEAATARESQPLNGRLVAVVAGLQKGTFGGQRAIRDLSSVSKDLGHRDYQYLLSTLGESDDEARVREWVVERINAMDLGVGGGRSDHPGAAGPDRLMRAAEAAQYGKRARSYSMNQPNQTTGSKKIITKKIEGDDVVIIDRE
jgi:hypothetical protein